MVLEGQDEVKLLYLTSTITTLKTSGKSTYNTQLRFFIKNDRICGGDALNLLALLVYTLEWPRGWVNSYVFPLFILLTKGREGATSLVFLGSLYWRRAWGM